MQVRVCEKPALCGFAFQDIMRHAEHFTSYNAPSLAVFVVRVAVGQMFSPKEEAVSKSKL